MSDAPDGTLSPVDELRFAKPKIQRTLNLPKALLERMRACQAWLTYEGPDDEPDSLADLAALALAKEVLRLESQYNGGEPFKTVRRKLRPGRPATGESSED